MLERKRGAIAVAAVVVPALVAGVLIGRVTFAQTRPQPTTPTPVPTVDPARSTPAPLPAGALPPTPPAPTPESSLVVTNRVIAGLDASRKRQLTSDVVAVKTFALHEPKMVEIVLHHLTTGAQVFIDSQGKELRRANIGPATQRAAGEQALEEVLRNASLVAKALELAR